MSPIRAAASAGSSPRRPSTGNSLCRLIIAEAVARANYGMKLGKFDRIGVDRAAAGPRTGRARFSARFPGGNGEKGWECFAKAYVETGAADRSAPVVRNDAARSAGGPRSTEPRRPWPKKTPLTPCPSPQGEGEGSESPPAPHRRRQECGRAAMPPSHGTPSP